MRSTPAPNRRAVVRRGEWHIHALSIRFMHNNFVHIHQRLRVTPAMAARVVDKLWDLEDIVRKVDEYDLEIKPRRER